jgi:hypothetical protein
VTLSHSNFIRHRLSCFVHFASFIITASILICLLAYFLTCLPHSLTPSLPPWCRCYLKSWLSLSLSKIASFFNGTRRFITVFTKVRHYTFIPQYAFMVWCSVKIKHGDNFTFTFYSTTGKIRFYSVCANNNTIIIIVIFNILMSLTFSATPWGTEVSFTHS